MRADGAVTRRGFHALAAGAFALGASPAAAQEKLGRLSYHWAPDHESAIMSKKFADEVNRRLPGKVRIETFPSGQLYSIRQIVSALSAGSVELGGVVTHNQFSAIDKDWNIVQFPNYFQSIEHQRRFFVETPEGRAARERILKKTGLVHIAYVPVGPYVTFSTKSDMSTPEKMIGLKARSLAAGERPGFLARGMDVVSLSTEEIFTALQSGMVETLATVPSAVKAYSWWEFLKFAQLPHMVYADAELMANGAWFSSLPQDVRGLVLEIGQEISHEATANSMRGSDQALREMVEKHGGKITILKGEQLEAFKKLDREKTEQALSKMVSPEILAAARRFVGQTN